MVSPTERAEGARPSQPEQAGDHVALDVGGPGVDAAADRVADVALELLTGDVAVAAVELEGVQARGEEALADVELGQSRVERRRLARGRAATRAGRRRGGRSRAAPSCRRSGARPPGTCRSACRTAAARAHSATQRSSWRCIVPTALARMRLRSHCMARSNTAMPAPGFPSSPSAGTSHAVEEQLAHRRRSAGPASAAARRPRARACRARAGRRTARPGPRAGSVVA